MNFKHAKHRIHETSSIARRIYGVKFTLKDGSSDASRWFLFNREPLKYPIKVNQTGLVLDIASYLGKYWEGVLKKNLNWLSGYTSPVPEFFLVGAAKFDAKENIFLSQKAVSADGHKFKMQIDGLRSRQKSVNFSEGVNIESISIQKYLIRYQKLNW